MRQNVTGLGCELYDPVHAAATWGEPVALCRNGHNSYGFLAGANHRRNSIYFSVDIVATVTMFDIATNKDVTIARKHGTTDPCRPNNICPFSHRPCFLEKLLHYLIW